MSKIVPTISSGVAGPLGVLHLPRLWQKASLAAAGKLHPDYAAAGPGFDQMVLDGLGIDRSSFLAFIRKERPSYAALEEWIRADFGGTPSRDSVAAINRALISYQHAPEVREEILNDCGFSKDSAITDALTLNQLDDLAAFHRQEIA